MYKYLLILLILAFGTWLQAQDIHFSQFDRSALLTNPANAGLSPGVARLSLQYRNQWNSVLHSNAYNSAMATFDWRSCVSGSFLAYGLVLSADRAGEPRFSNAQVLGNLAYHQRVADDVFLSGGVMAGFWNYGLDEGALEFEEQFDGIGFNGSFDSFESFHTLRRTVFDLSAGLLFYDTHRAWRLGMSLYHINQPLYSLLEDDIEGNRVGMGWALQGSIGLNTDHNFQDKELSLSARFRRQALFRNSLQSELLAGGQWQMTKPKNTRYAQAIFWGVATRLGGRDDGGALLVDAIIPSFRVDYHIWSFSLSYDINTSPLINASKLGGGMELSVQVNFDGKPNCVNCPEDW